MKEALLIENINIFDVVNGSFRKNQDILIENKHIKNILATGEIDDHQEVIDGTNKYAIPGLFECHAHLANLSTKEEAFKKQMLKKFLTSGVTQVRDVGGPLNILKQMKEDITRGILDGPEIFYSGPMLEKSPLAHGNHNKKMPGFTVAIDSKKDAEEIIKELTKGGASLVKTFNKFDNEVYEHLVIEAQKANLKIAHDPGIPLFHHIPMDKAMDLGINCFEHGKSPWPIVLKEELQKEHDALFKAYPKSQDMMMFTTKIFQLEIDAISEEKLQKLIDKMIENNVYFCPTLAFKQAVEELEPEFFGDDEVKKMAVQFIYNIGLYFTKEMIKRNVKMLIGHDGYDPKFTFLEMKILNEIGLSEIEAIRAATIYPAKWLGVDDQLGTIEENKKANILILNKNPLENIQNIKTTHLVIYKGKMIQ
ncbi:MAG: amidohydrolase family protein [Asgard group archaeon]|nr:amidohydrolase family protein [Asgard group archaeon]